VTAREPVFAAALEEAELADWGRSIGARPPLGSALCLYGPLGAGKSTLARAIGRGGGVETAMPSPTFNLVYGYDLAGGGRMLHFDLYRVEDSGELAGLGWEDVGDVDVLAVIEWAERAGGLLPAERWDVRLERAPGRPDLRRVRVTRVGAPPPLPLPPRGQQVAEKG